MSSGTFNGTAALARGAADLPWQYKKLGKRSYGCLMLLVPEPLRSQILAWTARIPEMFLTEEGREDKPHVTVKYGFTDSGPAAVEAICHMTEVGGPVRVKLAERLSLFRGGKDGDVLKIDILDAHQLHQLNGEVSAAFPTEDKYPDYHPHLTLAYLKPEHAGRYDGAAFPFSGDEVTFNQAEYSDPDNNRTRIALTVLPDLSAKFFKAIEPRKPQAPQAGNYFAECERDEGGHCLPSGEGKKPTAAELAVKIASDKPEFFVRATPNQLRQWADKYGVDPKELVHEVRKLRAGDKPTGEELARQQEISRTAQREHEAKQRREQDRESRLANADRIFQSIHYELSAAGAKLDTESESGSRYYTLPNGTQLRVADHEPNEATSRWMEREGVVSVRLDNSEGQWRNALTEAIAATKSLPHPCPACGGATRTDGKNVWCGNPPCDWSVCAFPTDETGTNGKAMSWLATGSGGALVKPAAMATARPKRRRPLFKSIESRKPQAPDAGGSYFAECERDEGGHCLPGDGAAEPKPDEAPAEKPTKNKVKDAYAKVAANAKAVKAGAAKVAGVLGRGVWQKIPPKVQTKLAASAAFGAAAWHAMEKGFAKGKQLATEVAKERGLSEQHVEKVGRMIAIADQVLAWTVNVPAATAATGNFWVGKAAGLVPVASLAYAAYSGARNPWALARAALTTIRTAPEHKGLHDEAVASMLEGFERGDEDWYGALLSAAIDATGGDLARAVELADAAFLRVQQPPTDGNDPEEWVLFDGDAGEKMLPVGSLRRKSLAWLCKDQAAPVAPQASGGFCQPGQTAAQTGCTPADGEGGKKPVKKRTKKGYGDGIPVLDPNKPPVRFFEEEDRQTIELLADALADPEDGPALGPDGMGWGRVELNGDKLIKLYGEDGLQKLVDKGWISKSSWGDQTHYGLTRTGKKAAVARSLGMDQVKLETKSDIERVMKAMAAGVLDYDGVKDYLGEDFLTKGLTQPDGGRGMLAEMLYRRYNPVPVWERVAKSRSLKAKTKAIAEAWDKVMEATADSDIVKKAKVVEEEMERLFNEVNETQKKAAAAVSEEEIAAANARINQLGNELEQHSNKLTELSVERGKVRRKAREELIRKVLKVKNPSPVSAASFDEAHTEPEREAVGEAARWLTQIVARGPNGETVPPFKVIRDDNPTTGRPGPSAYYRNSIHGINVHSGMTSVRTNVHEMGHGIEYTIPGVQTAAQQFLKHRVGDEPLRKLREVLPDHGYGEWEEGRKDDFAKALGESSAWYAGKKQNGQATEIVSMGIEELFANGEYFAAKDPEYCGFILGMLDGSIRDKVVPE